MAEKIRYVLEKPATLLFSSITEKSAPRGVQGATPKFSGLFGVEQDDFSKMIPLMVQCITSETGQFTGNPSDYYLACQSSKTACDRTRAKAELDAMGKSPDEGFKIREKAEKKCAVYANYAAILSASSQYDVELARLDAGRIIDITEPHARASAGKDLFYPGAIVVPSISLQGFRRKNVDSKDGVTAFLQNCLFIRKGPKIDLGGGGPNNQEVYSGFAGYSDYDPLANAPGGGTENWTGGTVQGSQGQGGQPQHNGGQANQGQQGHVDPNAGQGGAGGYQPQGGFQQGAQPSEPAW